MSTGTAKAERRKHRQRELPKAQDLNVLKTARKAQHQVASARAAVMVKSTIESGTARDLADERTANMVLRRAVYDLKMGLLVVSFVLGSAVVLLTLGAVT